LIADGQLDHFIVLRQLDYLILEGLELRKILEMKTCQANSAFKFRLERLDQIKELKQPDFYCEKTKF
jgi:hypothetical protein